MGSGMPLPPAKALVINEVERRQLISLGDHRSTPHGIVLGSGSSSMRRQAWRTGQCPQELHVRSHRSAVAEALGKRRHGGHSARPTAQRSSEGYYGRAGRDDCKSHTAYETERRHTLEIPARWRPHRA